jgi:hypothetical protein
MGALEKWCRAWASILAGEQCWTGWMAMGHIGAARPAVPLATATIGWLGRPCWCGPGNRQATPEPCIQPTVKWIVKMKIIFQSKSPNMSPPHQLC